MDYLHYVEFNAENLQFYLWLKDYTRRFDALPESERKLSPEWIPVMKETAVAYLEKDPKKAERRRKRDTVEGYEIKGAVVFGGDEEAAGPHVRKASVLSHDTVASTIAVVPKVAEVVAQGNLKWQPCKLSPIMDAEWLWSIALQMRRWKLTHRDVPLFLNLHLFLNLPLLLNFPIVDRN